MKFGVWMHSFKLLRWSDLFAGINNLYYTVIYWVRFTATSVWSVCIPLEAHSRDTRRRCFHTTLLRCTPASAGTPAILVCRSHRNIHTMYSVVHNNARDLNAIQTQQKLERINRAVKLQRQELEYVSTIKLQSWWRMIMGRKMGKRWIIFHS